MSDRLKHLESSSWSSVLSPIVNQISQFLTRCSYEKHSQVHASSKVKDHNTTDTGEERKDSNSSPLEEGNENTIKSKRIKLSDTPNDVSPSLEPSSVLLDCLEFELLISQLDQDKQLPKHTCLDKNGFDNIVRFLRKNYQCMSLDFKPELCTDYFYPNSIRKRVKTLNSTDQGSSSSRPVVCEWIRKLKVDNMVLRVPERAVGFKLNLNAELPTVPLPLETPYTLIRAQRILSFYLPGTHIRIDCKYCSQGRTEQEVKASDPTYHVELEVDQLAMLQSLETQTESNSIISQKILFQALNLIGFHHPLSIQLL